MQHVTRSGKQSNAHLFFPGHLLGTNLASGAARAPCNNADEPPTCHMVVGLAYGQQSTMTRPPQ